MERMHDCARVQEERLAASKDKRPEPERDEDGTLFDKAHQEILEMSEEQQLEELKGDF